MNLPFKVQGVVTMVLLAFSQQAFSQEEILPTVLVTATSYDQSIRDVQASVQLISSKDIAATPGISLLDTLDMAVGVDTRGTSLNSTASIRGMTSGGTLILYDGLRRTQKYGSRDINLYGVNDVERIEIVRGPMSALYGADAAGGVINVISKQPKFGTGLHGGISLTLGQSQGKQRETDIWSAFLEYGGEDFSHRISVEQRNRNPYRLDQSTYVDNLKAVDEEYINYAGLWQFLPNQKLRLKLEYVNQNDTGADQLARAPFNKFEAYEKEERFYGSVNYTGQVGPGLLSLDIAKGRSNAKTTRAYPLIETTDYEQKQFSARYVLPIGENTATFGIGRQDDSLDVKNNISRKGNRTNNYAFLQGDIKLAEDWNMLAGIRYDDFNDFGSTTNLRLSLQYTPGNWKIRTAYGQAFRAPTVLEQYAAFRRGTFLILGNSNLIPEENKSFEFAVGYDNESYKLDIAAYKTSSKNLITTIAAPRMAADPVGVLSRSVYANIGRATVKGVEVSGEWRLNQMLSLKGAYEYIHAYDDTTGKRLQGKPGSIARGAIKFESGQWTADLQGRYYFNYYNTHNTIRNYDLSSNYGTADLKVSHQFNKNVNISAGVINLFDRKTPDNWGAMYSLEDPPTRFFYLTGSYKF